jgi:DNA primase
MEFQYGLRGSWKSYLFERGFTLPSAKAWQFGWSERHQRITLPVRDEFGRLVGIKARAIDDRKPKYLNLRDEANDIEPYLKNEIVFGLHKARGSELIIVEGELNVISMHERGYWNTVGLNGSYFGERQIHLIRERADSAILFFDSLKDNGDPDQAGQDATEAVGEALRAYMPVKVVPDHYGDPASMHGSTIARCLREARSLTQIRLERLISR